MTNTSAPQQVHCNGVTLTVYSAYGNDPLEMTQRQLTTKPVYRPHKASVTDFVMLPFTIASGIKGLLS